MFEPITEPRFEPITKAFFEPIRDAMFEPILCCLVRTHWVNQRVFHQFEITEIHGVEAVNTE